MLLIENNIIHSMTSDANHGDCMQLMGCSGTTIVRNNLVWDCTQDIYFDTYSDPAGSAPWGRIYVYNNVVINKAAIGNGYGEGFYNGIGIDTRYNAVEAAYIFHNTLVKVNDGSGGFAHGDDYPIKTLKVMNNIFYEATNGAHKTGDAFENSHNLYYNTHWPINLGSDEKPWYINVGAEQAAISADPMFTADYHLQAGSPAIDKGVLVDVATDKDGVVRPQGTASDIGAYEYATGGCTAIHAADNNPCDHCIAQNELMQYIQQWKAGTVTLPNLMEAIRLWKSGC
jgi:hypothetical protein